MRGLFILAGLLGAAACSAGDFEAYRQKSLNPVEITKTKEGVSLELLKDGKANAIIVIPERRNDTQIPGIMYCGTGPVPFDRTGTFSAAFAAQELQKYIEKSTGVKLAVITEKEEIPARMIPVFVGISSKAKDYGFSQEGIPPEGFRVSCNGKAVGIIGAPAGKKGAYDGVGATLFGAYDFLERFLGTRFYYHGEEGVTVRKIRELVIPGLQYTDYPRYDHRYAFSWTWNDKADNIAQISALRWRSGGHGWGVLDVFQHTPGDLTQMFDKNKDMDCLQLDADGRRSSSIPPMPCYGNPKTMDYLLKLWTDYYEKKDPRSSRIIQQAHPKKDALGFSPPDHLVDCHCEYCREMRPDMNRVFFEQNSEGMGKFAQKLSWKVKEKFPGKRFYYLPYYTYCSPPSTGRFADNTYVRLCFLYGTSSYNDPWIQRKYREWVDGWVKATGHKISGYLYTNPDIKDAAGIVPVQAPHAYQKFFRDMRDRMTGFFSCGLHNNKFAIQAGLFTNYCIFRLMWNPDFDVDAAIKEMYREIFGPAAPQMGVVYDRLTENFERCRTSDFKKGRFGGPYEVSSISLGEVFEKILLDSDMKMIKDKLAEAEKRVQNADPIYQARYKYFSEPLKLTLKIYEFYRRGGKTDGKQIIAEPVGKHSLKIKIDGRLDEEIWGKAQCALMERAEMTLGNTESDVPTEIRILRYASQNPADSGLLVGMKMKEPRMSDRVTDVKDVRELFRGDSIEILLDPAPAEGKKSGAFIQYVISSDARMCIYPYDASGRNKSLKRRFAVHRGKDFWSAELLIPFDDLCRGIPLQARAGISRIKGNFVRTRVLKEKSGNKYRFMSRWRTNYQGNNHDIQSFGDIILRDNSGQYGDMKKAVPLQTREKPVIDGKFNEEIWKKAPVHEMSHFPLSLSKKPLESPMNFRILRYEHPTDKHKSGLIFGISIKEPKMKTAKLNVPDNQLHRADNLELNWELIPFTPEIGRYIILMDGRERHFGYPKPEIGIDKGEDYWNVEIFMPFYGMFSWGTPDPRMWKDIPGVRFNIWRIRRNQEPGGKMLEEAYRWNVGFVNNPFDINGYGMIVLNGNE